MIRKFMEVLALEKLEKGELEEFEWEVERVVDMYTDWGELEVSSHQGLLLSAYLLLLITTDRQLVFYGLLEQIGESPGPEVEKVV